MVFQIERMARFGFGVRPSHNEWFDGNPASDDLERKDRNGASRPFKARTCDGKNINKFALSREKALISGYGNGRLRP